MQTEAMKCYFVIYQNDLTRSNWSDVDKDVEQMKFSYIAGGSVNYITILENYLMVS